MLRLSLRRWRLRGLLRLALPYLPARSRVVDLGAGTAADLEDLRKLRPDLVGARAVLLEAQRGMLEKVPEPVRRAPSTHAVLGDAARLPLRDGSADLVLSVGLLCCVAEPSVPTVVAESVRVLAPGGFLLLAVTRWRGRSDEALHREAGLLRVSGGRAGRALFTKPAGAPAPAAR